MATILVRRGYDTPATAERFLRADERHDPARFSGIEGACHVVREHVRRGSRIVVHGDYDVDGVCSTAILVRALRRLGADPGWRLPSRFDGGYGLSVATIEELARSGTDLLIAVDCGITSAPEIDLARGLGMAAVVVDHHRPSERLPECPIVHPAVCGYPFPELCAAGVALKLAQALDASVGENPSRAEEADLDLVALATVADLVPLRDENRRLVRQGLRALARTEKPGLRALMAVASLTPGRLDARSAGFRLAPRLNAAGRMGRAEAALELLLTEDPARAEAVATELDVLNRDRRAAEERILAAAEAARAEAPDASALVLSGEGWHPGVIGIVASRMVERHHRPCVLISLDGETGRGSGRSIPAYDLHAGLTACAGHLRRYGGHRAAAGLELDAADLDAFTRDFLAHAEAALEPDDLVPTERIDAVVPATALGLELAEELEALAPFGQGNPCPTLLVPAARMSDLRGLGEEEQHTALTLSSGSARARVVAFGTAPGALRACGEDLHDLAARLEANEWNGAVEPRLLLRGFRRSETGECVIVGEESLTEALEREVGERLAVTRPSPNGWPPTPRELVDRRGEGVAGVLGDLISSGEPVVVVCADASRRRSALEPLLGGLGAALCAGADREPLALISWTALERDPALAREFPHLVALDPPRRASAERLLVGQAPAGAVARAYACWGPAEVDFALRAATASLDLRKPLAAVYRGLREAGGEAGGEALERCLRGPGDHPRPTEVCVRLLRIFLELGLARYVPASGWGPACRLLAAERVDLDRSPTYTDSLGELTEARAYLERDALRPRLDIVDPQVDRRSRQPPQPESQPELTQAAA